MRVALSACLSVCLSVQVQVLCADQMIKSFSV